MKKITLKITINGRKHTLRIDPNLRLLDLLRDELRLTGTKEGCGIGECGACTVILDGRAVNACLILAGQCNGREVVTIEGLTGKDDLHPLQQAFIDHGAVQCGFCTPGMIMSAAALLDQNPTPTEEDIREAISGNLCRCTGYTQIVEAIQAVADDN
ncbi:MAG: (2Fe-2S)-binding protein [Candidatus Euphemobacter frigidus]|nr:(2Fe-2S)-binding protein [Candidatus Euphemobacter frigidus]MDP8276392.1 (2Fe-2S)-binding protein [Candidatus Euphemobacter frigidus]